LVYLTITGKEKTMSTRLFLRLLLMVVVFIPLCATAQNLPQWPQTRTISAGETAWFTIPVTRTGPATLTLTWKNGPLTARVITPNNITIPVATTSSPMSVPLNITAADLQKGPLWSLALTVPASASLSAPVEATVNFQGQVVDMQALQAFSTRMASMRASASADAEKRFEQQVQQKIIASQQAQTMQIATQNRNLSRQLLSTVRGAPAVSQTINKSLPTNLTQAQQPVATGNTTQSAPSPVLNFVKPLQATTGIWVTLTGQNFTPNDQVFFVAENGAEIPAAKQFQSATALQTQVPGMGEPSNTLRTVSICLKSIVNGTAVKSNFIPFQLFPPPTITSLDRGSGLPGESLLVNGVGFQDPKVHFQMPAGGRDYVMYPKFNEWNVAQVYVKLPDIPLVPINGMQLNVTVESNGLRSAPKLFTLMPILEEMTLPEVAWKNFKQHDGADKISNFSGYTRVEHNANYFDAHFSTEYVAPTVTLQNGWKVVRIDIWSEVIWFDNVYGHADFSVPAVTDADLTVKVDWWVRCGGYVCAGVSYIIKGPKGIPYK
jgi:hypothetical protein